MRCVERIADLRELVADERLDGHAIGFVPTMGALHAGHLSLVSIAAGRCDVVVVSIFVNPTQFERSEDLASYPRDLDADLRALDSMDLDIPIVVFAPTVDEMYPRASLTTVRVDGVTDELCGRSRPGHFDGVATVVTKLLSIVRPDVAVFGLKDRQQLTVVSRLVDDLNLDVRVVDAPIVREADGLAISSRNARLSPAGRERALRVSRSLAAGVRLARAQRAQGVLRPRHVLSAMTEALEGDGVTIDYVELVDPDTFLPIVDDSAGPSGSGEPVAPASVVAAVAAYVDDVRLIDNVLIGSDDEEHSLLAYVDAPTHEPTPQEPR